MPLSEHKRAVAGKGTFPALCLAGAAALCTIILLAAKPGQFSLPEISMDGILDGAARRGQVKCSVASNSGSGLVRIGLALPYRDPRQREELTQKMPRLQHAFTMAMNRPEMDEFIRERNFEAIRRHFLQVVNEAVDDPVENIYFESFFHN